MPNWQRRLDIMIPWQQAEEGTLPVHELAKIVSDRLLELQPFGIPYFDEDREQIADEFKTFYEDESEDKEWFDAIMSSLYDWADQTVEKTDSFFETKKVCWVKRS